MHKGSVLVDGAAGEGGGQVLRASLALSMAFGRPFRMINIRANRPKPGLKRQHLTCLHAARDICGATVSGDSINSMTVSFAPGPVKGGEYHFDIGSGGSCTLVLQALMPPLLTAAAPSRLTVTGGTHVPHAPVFEFLRETLFPWLEKLGPRLNARMERPGFMQIGGGRISVEITPVAALTPLAECACGEFAGTEAQIISHNLEPHVAEREYAALRSETFAGLKLTENSIHTAGDSRSASGTGNAVLVTVRRESGVTVCSGIGQRGLAAESVARQAAERAMAFLHSQAPVDRYLADQLLVPLALAGGGVFLTEKPTPHTQTCMKLLPLFTNTQAHAEPHTAGLWRFIVE